MLYTHTNYAFVKKFMLLFLVVSLPTVFSYLQKFVEVYFHKYHYLVAKSLVMFRSYA